ncbi:MAG: Stealth CR1 domain-containing protein [Pseudomonadota bacterium]
MPEDPLEANSDEPIDVVYTWVDGEAPEYRAALRAYLESQGRAEPAASLSRIRFQQHDELRYSLRSLVAYAPWIRRVYLVTNGQQPRWLNSACDRMTLVTHREIFPDPSHLPTFNSFAIQLHMHRIPGLSRRFLYFNDDFLLGRPTTRDDFLTPRGGQVFHLNEHPANSDPDTPDLYQRAEARSQAVLETLGAAHVSRRRCAHAPVIYDGDVFQQLKALAPEAFESTSASRLRSGNCIFVRLLYTHYLLELSEQRDRHRVQELKIPSEDHAHFDIVPRPLRFLRNLLSVSRRQPKFICINDDLDPPNGLVSWQLNQYFRLNFPKASEFETSR